MSGKLLKNQRPKRWPHFGSDHHSGFGAEIAAEALEVGTEQHDVAAQVFVDQMRIRGRRRQRGGALEVNLLKARHPVILPEQQRSGGHGRLPPVNFLDISRFTADLNGNNRGTREARRRYPPSGLSQAALFNPAAPRMPPSGAARDFSCDRSPWTTTHGTRASAGRPAACPPRRRSARRGTT
jgi:hypothetical protein